MERASAGTGRRRRPHAELDRPDRALRRADAPAGERHGRRPAPVLQAGDARSRPRRPGRPRRAAPSGGDGHPGPLGRAARQGADGGGRRLRGRLGDRGRSPGAAGAPPRPGAPRGPRRARPRSLRVRALREDVPVEPADGGRARPAVRPPPRPRRGGPASDPDRRRVRRGDQRAVPGHRAPAAPLDAERRRRGRRAGRLGLRRGRRRRGASLAVPGRAPASARAGAGEARLGGPAAAERPGGAGRRAGHDAVPLGGQRDREHGRRRVVARAVAGLDAPPDVERAPRRWPPLDDGQAALRRRPAGRALLSRSPPRARPRGRRLPVARCRVPRHLVRGADGTRDRLRVERHLGRHRCRRPVRRDALRQRRHVLPLARAVPFDDDRRRRHDRRPARRGRPAARLPRDGPRPGDRLRDRRRPARRDLGQALHPGPRARVAAVLPRALAQRDPLGAELRPRRGEDGAGLQLGLCRQPRHRAVHERPRARATADRRRGAPDEGDRRVRVAGVPLARRPRAGGQPGGRADPQLEQQTGGGRDRRRPVDVGRRAAGRPSLGRHRAPAASTRSRASSA